MSYLIFIERHAEEPITVVEWDKAVSLAPLFRLRSADTATLTNPQTGETIARDSGSHDAAYFDTTSDTWHPALTWDAEGGRAMTRATRTFDNPNDPYRRALVNLAATLSASVVGQEGEVYD